jgi:hypothetical protein
MLIVVRRRIVMMSQHSALPPVAVAKIKSRRKGAGGMAVATVMAHYSCSHWSSYQRNTEIRSTGGQHTRSEGKEHSPAQEYKTEMVAGEDHVPEKAGVILRLERKAAAVGGGKLMGHERNLWRISCGKTQRRVFILMIQANRQPENDNIPGHGERNWTGMDGDELNAELGQSINYVSFC